MPNSCIVSTFGHTKTLNTHGLNPVFFAFAHLFADLQTGEFTADSLPKLATLADMAARLASDTREFCQSAKLEWQQQNSGQ